MLVGGVDHLLVAERLAEARAAQQQWAELPVAKRLEVVRAFRRLLARNGRVLAEAIGLADVRSVADSISAEVIPLAEAASWLEKQAEIALEPKRTGKSGRPSWLKQTEIVVRREPLGVVLVIAPSNYPLFLAGAQTLQALTAGNAVLWKPGLGGSAIANRTAGLFQESGLPDGLLTVLPESVESAERAIGAGVDRIILTGSERSGRAVLKMAAEHLIPATVELSGCDAFFVLPGADLPLAARALLFGLSFNGSRTCIAPRRIFVHSLVANEFYSELAGVLRDAPLIPLAPALATEAAQVVEDAERQGARTLLSSDRIAPHGMRPMVLTGARPSMRIFAADLFAPVAGAMTVDTLQEALSAAHQCPYALGASVFGAEKYAESLAQHLRAGVVVKNDVIAPTADPRLSFGGVGRSGFGKTRGMEGLLEMTVSKSIITQNGRRFRHLEPAHPKAQQIFEAYLRIAHGGGFVGKLRAAASLGRAVSAKQK